MEWLWHFFGPDNGGFIFTMMLGYSVVAGVILGYKSLRYPERRSRYGSLFNVGFLFTLLTGIVIIGITFIRSLD